MITATSGTSGPTRGRRGVTRVVQPLSTDSVTHSADSALAAANGQASQGRDRFRCVNNHGR
jgi:hypothetical protein